MSSERVMKIGYLYDGHFDDRQGVPVYVDSVGNYMREVGHDTEYIVGSSSFLAKHITAVGKTATIGANGNRVEIPLPISRRRAQGFVDELAVDVLHLQMPHVPWMSGRIIERTPVDIPLISTFHVLPATRTTELYMRAMAKVTRRTNQRIDRMITNSSATQDFVYQHYGKESTLIPCPIELEKMQAGRMLEEYNDGMINVVFLGRLVERKGADHLVRAVASLRKATRENVRLIIAGEGELEAALKEQVARNYLTEQTIFLGYISEERKADVLASAHIAAFPSPGGESFGMAPAEAMAARAGVVIGFRNPGYSYVLRDTPEALVDPSDPGAFTDLLEDLVIDETVRKQLYATQQDSVVQYGIATIGPQIEQVYQQALAS